MLKNEALVVEGVAQQARDRFESAHSTMPPMSAATAAACALRIAPMACLMLLPALVVVALCTVTGTVPAVTGRVGMVAMSFACRAGRTITATVMRRALASTRRRWRRRAAQYSAQTRDGCVFVPGPELDVGGARTRLRAAALSIGVARIIRGEMAA